MHSPCHTMYEPMARLARVTRWLRGCCLGNDPQIMGEYAPADPPFHTRSTMIAAAVQFMPAFQATDPPLQPCTPVMAAPEPSLLLMCDPFGRFAQFIAVCSA